MNTEEVIVYRGIIIKCPLCGRNHGLILKSSLLNAPHTENDRIWIQCPTCNLEFEGTAVARWKKTKAFEELSKTVKIFTNTMNKLSSTTKTVYTIFLLDEVNHTVTRCLRTPMNVDGLSEVLERLSKTCRPGESYIAIEEAD